MTSADPNASMNGENEDENNKAKQVKIDFHSLNQDHRLEFFRIKSANKDKKIL